MKKLMLLFIFLSAVSTYSQFRLSVGFINKLDHTQMTYVTPLLQIGSDEHTFVTGVTINKYTNVKKIDIGYSYRFNKTISAGIFTPIGHTGEGDFVPFAKITINKSSILIGTTFNFAKKHFEAKHIVFGFMYDIH